MTTMLLMMMMVVSVQRNHLSFIPFVGSLIHGVEFLCSGGFWDYRTNLSADCARMFIVPWEIMVNVLIHTFSK